MRRFIALCLSFMLALAAGCGGGGGGGSPPPPAPPPPPPPPVVIGGTVTGLVGTGLTLQNGTGAPLAITADGAFQFPGTVANGTTYYVRVATQPGTPMQYCSAPNGAGVATSNTAITVVCNSGTPRHLYATDFAANLLYGFAVDGATGTLASVGAPAATGVFPLEPAVAPIGAYFTTGAGGFVYVRNSSAGTVSAFSIDSATGALTAVPGSPFNLTGQGNTIVQTLVSPTGRYIYFLDQGPNGAGPRRIFAFTIQANGALVAVAGSPFNAVDTTHRLMIDPLGRYLYGATSSFASSQVTTYLVSVNNGALLSVGTPVNGTFGLARGVVHPSGRFLYVARDSQGAQGQPLPAIDAYSIDTSIGQLTAIGSVAAALNNQSNVPVMDPQGRFLYVSGPGGVMGFAINPNTGALTAVPGGAVLVGANIGQGDIDATGRFLYSPIRQNPGEGIAMHMINQTTGALSVIAGTPFPIGAGVVPNYVEADASGRWLFVASFGDNRVTSLAINPTTGVLTFVDSESAGTNATQFMQAGTQ
jgi:6-phosphogluconolactonase (cycloisomerase 2 family)